MYTGYELHPNVPEDLRVNLYECDGCSCELKDMWFMWITKSGVHFCRECSFRLRLIDQSEYKNCCGIYHSGMKAIFQEDGEIIIIRAKEVKSSLKRRTLTKAKRFAILERDNFRCKYCGATPSQNKLHVDHIKPKSIGGSDDEKNLVTACSDCNLGKSNGVLTKNKTRRRKNEV